MVLVNNNSTVTNNCTFHLNHLPSTLNFMLLGNLVQSPICVTTCKAFQSDAGVATRGVLTHTLQVKCLV